MSAAAVSCTTCQVLRPVAVPLDHQISSSRKTLLGETINQSGSFRRAASYAVCLVSTAQAMRASLLATAQATTFECRRVNIERIHSPSRSVRFSTRWITARAPCTSKWRRCLSPCLLIPHKTLRPPVLCCRGTSPIEAAKFRPPANWATLPTYDARRIAVMVPIPGIDSNRVAFSSSCSWEVRSRSTSSICWSRYR